MQEQDKPPAASADALRGAYRLEVHALAVLVLLTLQYALGMANNFWLSLPDAGEYEAGSYFVAAWTQGMFGAHVVNGAIIMIALVCLVARACWHRDVWWAVTAFASLVGVGVAIAGGVRFVQANAVSQSAADSFSFMMSWGFILAFWGLVARFVRFRVEAASATLSRTPTGSGA